MTVAAGDHGWFDQLSDDDLNLLSRLASDAGVESDAVRRHPGALAQVMSHPAAFDSVFRCDHRALAPASPFLTFALIVHRGWAELQSIHHIDEWVGPRRRLPVLGGDEVRAFLAGAQRRLFLTELLASYTRVTSGSVWVRTPRGSRRRRFSELDPVRLASLLDVVPEAERPGVYRRLGDLALFLTGVFPITRRCTGWGHWTKDACCARAGSPPSPSIRQGEAQSSVLVAPSVCSSDSASAGTGLPPTPLAARSRGR
ncbi:MAG: hypothetical protein M3P53_06180 [Actinomycetota bacterium]|nr:hypothetical protein [Actinomycetota bacterium]